MEAIEIVAALRIKNEGRWIREVLRAIGWCRAIYVMDDHSEDDTAEIAADCGAVVHPSPFDSFDEARDKEWLIDKVAERHRVGTWVLMQDGDEVLEKTGQAKIRQCVANAGGARAFTLRVKYLWNDRSHYRIDGVYGQFKRLSLFMLLSDHRFMRSGVNGNLHPSCVPVINRPHSRQCPAVLMHLGYMNKEDRIRKWKFYNSMDPRNQREGWDSHFPERGSYPHIVQGDIPEVPITAKLLHGGPLRLMVL